MIENCSHHSASRRAPCPARWLAWLALLPLAVSAAAGELSVRAECRDDIAHGAYRIETAQGIPRIEGRYANGRREGEFVFYSAGGSKSTVLPYANGLLLGTVKAWHAGSDGGPGALKLVSDISAGFIQGRHQTWYENGKRRSDFVIEDGELASGEAWHPDGTVLQINDDSRFLNTEIQSDFEYYDRLERVMDAYPPAC